MKLLLFLLSFLVCGSALAQFQSNGGPTKDMPATILVKRVPFGSGTPGPDDGASPVKGYDVAEAVGSGLYQVPGYLPYRPSAGVLYPRVVQVKCVIAFGLLSTESWTCDGYSISPALGRGEYILIQPILATK
jgi:hypothetical protein